MKRALIVSLYVAGAACLVVGACLMHPAVGCIVLGLALLTLAGLLVAPTKEESEAAESALAVAARDTEAAMDDLERAVSRRSRFSRIPPPC